MPRVLLTPLIEEIHGILEVSAVLAYDIGNPVQNAFDALSVIE